MAYRKEQKAIEIGRTLAEQLQSESSDERAEQIEAWLRESEESQALYAYLKTKGIEQALSSFSEYDYTSAMARVMDRYEEHTRRERTRSWRYVARVAAVVIGFLLLSGGGYLWFLRVTDHAVGIGSLTAISEDVAPGSNRAMLILGDGSVVNLKDSKEGIVSKDGTIAYVAGESIDQVSDRDGVAQMLTLATPNGGTYQIVLPDGSKVWLNASSKIKYPSFFDSKSRVVEIEGEAYFEVVPLYAASRKKVPFIVKTERQEIEVLGTSFNISAYTDESTERSTLVDGKVLVRRMFDKEGVILSPNQQSILRNQKLEVSNVDVQPEISWKDGRFSFDGKTFPQLMQELGRWYDIDIVYEDGVPDIQFYGGMFRNKKLSVILKALESADIQYRIENKALIIEKKH